MPSAELVRARCPDDRYQNLYVQRPRERKPKQEAAAGSKVKSDSQPDYKIKPNSLKSAGRITRAKNKR